MILLLYQLSYAARNAIVTAAPLLSTRQARVDTAPGAPTISNHETDTRTGRHYQP